MIKIVVNCIPPSNNKYLGNSHSFHSYANTKTQWHWMIKAAIKNKPIKPFEKARVHIRYYFKNRIRRDPDNYSGKMILDPLVREGILKDDSFGCVTLELSCEYDKENPRTEIYVEEIKA